MMNGESPRRTMARNMMGPLGQSSPMPQQPSYRPMSAPPVSIMGSPLSTMSRPMQGWTGGLYRPTQFQPGGMQRPMRRPTEGSY